MIIAATGSLQAGENTPIVYRGRYEEIFPMMAEDGYHGVELHIRDSREIDRKELEKQLGKNRLILTSIGTGAAYGAWHWNIGSHDRELRRKAIECLEEHMITAAPHHALIIIGSMQGRFRDALSEEEFINNIEESLYLLDRLAVQYEVSLGYEIMNHYESDFLYWIEDGVRFLEEHSYKRVGLHIDTVHMNIDESDLGNAIRRAGSWIRHVRPGMRRIHLRGNLQMENALRSSVILSNMPLVEERLSLWGETVIDGRIPTIGLYRCLWEGFFQMYRRWESAVEITDEERLLNGTAKNFGDILMGSWEGTLGRMYQYFLLITVGLIESRKQIQNASGMMPKVVDFLELNYMRKISQQECADYFHLNKDYLSRAFKKHTGVGMAKYLNNIRIRKAKELLKSTDLQVMEIADQVGYFDAKYFSRQFKLATGMTPAQYRQDM